MDTDDATGRGSRAAAPDAVGPIRVDAEPLHYEPALDGIRAVAVLAVMAFHFLGAEYFAGGLIGVDVFFVLSGFLITSLLLDEQNRTGAVSLRGFYHRRVLRLFPAMYTLLGLVAVAAIFIGAEYPSVWAELGAAALYSYQIFLGLFGFATPDSPRVLFHLWSLSVEEWFYFAIPTTVLVCIRRNWIKQLGWLLGAGIVAIGVARWFAYTGFWQDDAGMISGIRLALLQRPDGLMLGALLAIVNAHLTAERIDRLRKPIVVVATVGLVVWAVALTTSFGLFEKLGLPYFKYLPDGPEQFSRPQMLAQSPVYWFRWGHTLGIFAFGAILFGLVHCRRWWLARAWSWRPFQWMGRMSYTLYVWHALPYVFIIALTGGEEASPTVQVLRLPVLIAAAFAVSLPVYYFVELRALRVKLRFSAEKEALDLTTGKMVRVEDGKVSSLPPESDPGGAADRGPDGPPSA